MSIFSQEFYNQMMIFLLPFSIRKYEFDICNKQLWGREELWQLFIMALKISSKIGRKKCLHIWKCFQYVVNICANGFTANYTPKIQVSCPYHDVEVDRKIFYGIDAKRKLEAAQPITLQTCKFLFCINIAKICNSH